MKTKLKLLLASLMLLFSTIGSAQIATISPTLNQDGEVGAMITIIDTSIPKLEAVVGFHLDGSGIGTTVIGLRMGKPEKK